MRVYLVRTVEIALETRAYDQAFMKIAPGTRAYFKIFQNFKFSISLTKIAECMDVNTNKKHIFTTKYVVHKVDVSFLSDNLTNVFYRYALLSLLY